MYGVDIFTPNQKEAESLLAIRQTGRLRRSRAADAKQMGADLLAAGPACVVLKLGAKGAMIQDRGGYIHHVNAFEAKVVDTTAAGDAFTGALGVALAEGKDIAQAVKFANAAGAICCEGFGAQPSLPTRQAVEAKFKSR